MDIKAFIKSEAPRAEETLDPSDKHPSIVHDKAYKAALTAAYSYYNGMEIGQLKRCQISARTAYDSTHRASANCMVLYELIKEKTQSRGDYQI